MVVVVVVMGEFQVLLFLEEGFETERRLVAGIMCGLVELLLDSILGVGIPWLLTT